MGKPGETGERKERGCPSRVGVGGIPELEILLFFFLIKNLRFFIEPGCLNWVGGILVMIH